MTSSLASATFSRSGWSFLNVLGMATRVLEGHACDLLELLLPAVSMGHRLSSDLCKVPLPHRSLL